MNGAHRATRLAASAAAVALAVLSACTGSGPKAGTLSTPPTTPSSTSASSTPSPTPTPVEAQVEAAVRNYYAELNRAARTGDTSVLRTLSTQGCPCFRSVRVIDANARKGYTSKDVNVRPVSIRVHDVAGLLAVAEVKTQEAPYDVLSGTTVIGHVPVRHSFVDLSMVQEISGAWIIGNEFNLLRKP